LVLPFWKLSEPDLGREEFATELGVPWPQDLAVKRVTLHDLAAATPRLLGFRRDGPEMRTAVLVGPRAKWLVIE